MVRCSSGALVATLSLAVAAFAGCSAQTPSPGGQAGSGGAAGAPGSAGAAGSGATAGGGSGGRIDGSAGGGTAPSDGSGGSPSNQDAPPERDTGANDTGFIPGDAGADRPSNADGGPATCVPGALLCEDFEGYGPGAAGLSPGWTTDVVGGTIQVDTTRPFSGAKGLHITATASTANLLQIIKQGAPLFPVPGNTFYGRMMMWMTQMPTGGVHFNTVQANGLMPGTTQIAKYAYGAMYARLMAGYTVRVTETALPLIDCGKSGPAGYPERSWVCAEWKFDGPNNEMHYWLNGQAQTGVDVIRVGGGCTGTQPAGGVWQAPVFNKLMLGWYSQPFNAPIEMWMDDVVVGTERIGCPAPP